jgi:hypothetical protein
MPESTYGGEEKDLSQADYMIFLGKKGDTTDKKYQNK